MNDKTFTLIVWASLPDTIDTYLVPNDVLVAEHREFLRQAHGKYINSTQDLRHEDISNDGLAFLNAALSPKKEYVSEDEGMYQWACYLYEYKIASPIEDVVITHVYSSGFIL